MTSNAKTDTSVNSSTAVNISVGSGIAIAAIWFFATVLIIFAALFFFADIFVDNSAAREEVKGTDEESSLGWLYLVFLVITLLPGFAAYWLTKMFVGANDD